MILVNKINVIEECIDGLALSGYLGDFYSAVIGLNEEAVVIAASLGLALDIPAIRFDVAHRYRNKLLQKAAIRAAGIPTPKSEVLGGSGDLNQTVVDYRRVLKPVSGAGTANVSLVEVGASLPQIDTDRDRSPWAIEEWIDGEEHHIDGVVRDGEILFSEVTRYGIPCLAAMRSGSPMRTLKAGMRGSSPKVDQELEFAAGCLSALGAFTGTFHMELFDTDAGFVFSECAARRGGGMVQEETLAALGVDLSELSLKAVSGRRVSSVDARPIKGAVGTTFLPGEEGFVLARPEAAELYRAFPLAVCARVDIPLGFHMPRTNSTIIKMGAVTVRASSASLLDSYLDQVVAWWRDRTHIVKGELPPRDLRKLNPFHLDNGASEMRVNND
ncbi:ATP-grasp domain-containing protein [Propionibacterium freudenreichii]|uniref:ATP-grasp domain-containing protein n=1 Tax=Propionibacterium freudenreichii TaxID=1744 RepID=UPI00254FC5E3|nr:hypothetical protein [Propionibacterium freudenreichii]MDK9662920.1 hypothetical protein [Propionibacterium freudenreichii]